MSDSAKLEVEVTLQDKASPKAREVGQSLSTGLGQLGSVLGGVVSIGATAAVAGLTAVGAGLTVAMSEAMEAQEGMAQLDAVLKSTGGAAGVTRDAALALADSFQQTTRFADDAILSGENILLTFTNIGKDTFPMATQTMLDMSTALGQDLKSSAIQLGKALQDPTDGVSALQRVGVNFTDAQKAAIKAMVESGDAAGAQAMILKELQTEFGGSAEAAGKTFAGQLDILKNQFLSVAETAGNALLPAVSEAMTTITPLVLDLANQFADFVKSDQFKAWVQAIVNWLKNDLPAGIQKTKDFWNNQLLPVIRDAKPIFDKLLPVFGKIIEVLGTVLPPIITAFVEGWGLIIDGFNFMLTPITTLIDSWGFLSGKIKEVKDALANLSLPDWLKPGSPTPLEIGVRGITDALGGMAGTGLPGVNIGLRQLPGAVGVGGGGGSVVINFNAPVMGFSDEYALAQKLAPIIRAEINKR